MASHCHIEHDNAANDTTRRWIIILRNVDRAQVHIINERTLLIFMDDIDRSWSILAWRFNDCLRLIGSKARDSDRALRNIIRASSSRPSSKEITPLLFK